MTEVCQCTKYAGCDPCRHDAVRYADALVRINCLLNKPTATLRNAVAIARAALDGEG